MADELERQIKQKKRGCDKGRIKKRSDSEQQNPEKIKGSPITEDQGVHAHNGRTVAMIEETTAK